MPTQTLDTIDLAKGSRGEIQAGEVANELALSEAARAGERSQTLFGQAIPGLDQVFAYDRGSRMYKVVSSAAQNYGRRRVMSETYGATKNMPVQVQ